VLASVVDLLFGPISGLVFEYDMSSPKARKAYKKELRRRFPPTKK